MDDSARERLARCSRDEAAAKANCEYLDGVPVALRSTWQEQWPKREKRSREESIAGMLRRSATQHDIRRKLLSY